MKVVVDKVEFVGKPEEEIIAEAEHLKEMIKLPTALCASYLKFINEKGLLKEYLDWRVKKIEELL